MKNTKDYVSEYVNSTTKNFKDEMFNKTMHYQKQYGFGWMNIQEMMAQRFQDIIGQGRGIIDYKR